MSDKKEKFFKKIEIEDSDEKGDKKDVKSSFPKKKKSDDKEKKDIKSFFSKKEKFEDKDKKELDEGKNDRCWKGYKPAKGKKPYSDGSCIKESTSLWNNWKQLRESNESCSCQCKSCKEGSCQGCSCDDCNCRGCSC